MRPLGHRILVRPDTQPETSASGLHLSQDRDFTPCSGVVVELGAGGPQMRYRARQRAIGDCLEMLETTKRMFGPLAALVVAIENIAGLLGTSEPEREIRVGDRVAFPGAAGLSVCVDGEWYIILNEDDVCVVVEEAAA